MSDGHFPLNNSSEAEQTPPQKHVIAFPQELLEKALVKVQRQANGNGIHAKNIRIHSHEGQIYNFEANISLHLKENVSSETIAGQATQGEIISNGQTQSAIHSYLSNIIHDPNLSFQLRQDISSRPDKGFGLCGQTEDNVIARNVYIEHHQCQPCQGQGQTVCGRCHGQKSMPCNKCGGSASIPCVMCRGSGVIRNPSGNEQQCHHCYGRGMASCDGCQGRGQIVCTACAGTGASSCASCATTGVQSQVTTLNVLLNARAETDLSSLPQALQKLIKSTKLEQLIINGDASAQKRNQTDQKNDHHVEEKYGYGFDRSQDQQGLDDISYKIELPFAKIALAFGPKKKIQGYIAGYNAKIFGFQRYMDMLISPAIKKLQAANKLKIDSTKALAFASQYSLVKKALKLTYKGKEKIALKTLMMENPNGLSKKAAIAVIKAGDKLFKNMTRKTRYIALIANLCASAMIFFIYLNQQATMRDIPQNLFKSLNGLVPIPAISGFLDILFLCLFFVLSIVTIRFAAFKTLTKSIGHLGLNQNDKEKKTQWPKAGKTALYLTAALPIIFLMLALIGSELKPYWLLAFTGS